MKQYPFPNNRWQKAAFGVFLFVMLLLARDTLITSLRLGFYRSQFLMLAAIVVLGLAFLLQNRGQLREIVTDRRIFWMLGLALPVILIMVLKRDWQIMYFSIALCLIFPVFLTYFTDSCRVSRYYVVILTALALYSLIATYFLRNLVWAGYLTVPVKSNDANMEFFDFFLCYAGTNPYWRRNFGIFREPGVYQFFLLLGLYLNNYTADWERKRTAWLCNGILTVTMISTFSIVGYAALGAFALFLFFDKGYHRTKTGRIAAVSVCVALAAGVAVILIAMRVTRFGRTPLYEFYDMVVRLTTDSDSLLDRLSAIFTDLRFFLKHPLLGAEIAPVLHGTNHNTSSTLILFAVLGVFGGTMSVVAWGALVWKKERHILGNLILLGIFLMCINTQNLIADVFFWLFPCMALTERGLPLHKLPKKEDL